MNAYTNEKYFKKTSGMAILGIGGKSECCFLFYASDRKLLLFICFHMRFQVIVKNDEIYSAIFYSNHYINHYLNH